MSAAVATAGEARAPDAYHEEVVKKFVIATVFWGVVGFPRG